MTFTPRPGPAPLPRMVAAQAFLETRLLLRNGEQVLLLIVIPSLLLVVVTTVPLVDLGPGPRIDALTPGLIALAVMATAFTGQAIATGYERRYGALKLLGASPLPRWGLLAGKTGSVLAVETAQVALLAAIAAALGWSPHGSPAAVVTLLVAATAAFSALGLLMAGTLRAEATLAAANLVFVLLLVFGGVVAPLEHFPAALRPVLEALPTAALAEGLQAVLERGEALPWGSVGILAAWAVAAGTAATATFRWE